MLNWTCARNLSKSNPEVSGVESFKVSEFKKACSQPLVSRQRKGTQNAQAAGWGFEELDFFPGRALFIHLPLTTEVRSVRERSLPLRSDLSPLRISTGFHRDALVYSVFKCGRCVTPATYVETQSEGRKMFATPWQIWQRHKNVCPHRYLQSACDSVSLWLHLYLCDGKSSGMNHHSCRAAANLSLQCSPSPALLQQQRSTFI